MSNRNRRMGNQYELFIAKEFEYILDRKIVTSRSESRSKDAAGIDLCNTEPLAIQCKLTANIPNLKKIFDKMEGYNNGQYINMIAWGKTRKVNKNFVKDNDYIIIPLEDFRALVEYLENKQDES